MPNKPLEVTANIPAADDAKKELSDHLKPFAPYVGITFRGEFVGSTPEKPIYDLSRWERALIAKAVGSGAFFAIVKQIRKDLEV